MTLTGCNSKPAPISTKSTAEKLAPVELTWYYLAGASPDQDKVFEKANKITKEKINATVKYIPLDMATYEDKMKLIIASGDDYDICWTSSWKNNYSSNAEKGAFLALDDDKKLLEKYAPSLKALIPQKYWDTVKVNVGGKTNVYGIINYQVIAFTKGMWFNKSLAAKYNFDVSKVKSYKDVVPFLEAVKKNEPTMYPLDVDQGGAWNNAIYSYPLEWGGGGSSLIYSNKKDYKLVDQLQTPEYKDLLTTIRDWYKKGYVRQDVLSIKDTTAERKTGKYACGWLGTYKPGVEAEFKKKMALMFLQQ